MGPLAAGGGSGAGSQYTRVEFEITVADEPELNLKSAEVITAQTQPDNHIPGSDGEITIQCDVNYLYDDVVQDVAYFEKDWKSDKTYLVVIYDFGVRSLYNFQIYVYNAETGESVEEEIQAENKASGSGSEAADQIRYYFENQLALTLGIDDNQFFLLNMALPMLGLILSIAFGQPILMVIFLGVSAIFLIVGASAVIVYYATNQDQIPGMNVFDDLIAGLENVSWAAGSFIDFLIFWKTVWLFLYIFLTILVYTMRFIVPFIILTYILKWVMELQTFMEIGGRSGG